MPNDATIAILAGGQSQRMGTDKSFVPVGGKPLIQHVIERVLTLELPVILITNSPEQYAVYDLPMYQDVYPQRSSLGGIFTALYHSTTDYTLCVACDMPFLNTDLLDYMLDLCTGVDAVVPYRAGNYESLHAIYRQSCRPVIQDQLEQGRFRINDIYTQLQIRRITQAEVEQFDAEHRSFVNLNTPDDVAYVLKGLS